MNYFFLHHSSGKLMYLPEVPKEPIKEGRVLKGRAAFEWRKKWSSYQLAFKEAKEKSVEVKNQAYLENALFSNFADNPNHEKEISTDVIYSLDDSYKVEIVEERIGAKVFGQGYHINKQSKFKLAIVSVVNQKIK